MRAEARERSLGTLEPRAVIAVDLFGLPADYDAIEAVANRHGMAVIEDGAQSFGGAIRGRKACSFGRVSTTSFFPAKPLGCYGDGGAVFTDDASLATLLRSLRVHGQGEDKYDNIHIGLNSRLDTLQAAILLEKLTVFDDEIARRNQAATMLNAALAERFIVPRMPDGFRSAWAQYTIRPRANDREFYLRRLREADVPTAIYYTRPLHLQPVFADLELARGTFPVAERLSDEVFSLPVHPYLRQEDLERIISVLLEPE